MCEINKFRIGIRISANGVISIPAHAATMIGLQSGDAIDIIFTGPEVYLTAVKNPSHDQKGIARPAKGKTRYYRVYWKELAIELLNRSNTPNKDTAAFRVGQKTTFNSKEVIPIIIRRNYAI